MPDWDRDAVKRRDRLRDAPLGDVEVGCGQVLDEAALRVGHDHRHFDEIDPGPEHRRLRRLTRQQQRGAHQHGGDGRGAPHERDITPWYRSPHVCSL